MKSKSIVPPSIVSSAEWLTARRALLREEKEFTRQRERLTVRRRELPWVKVETSYAFDSTDGRVSLPDLFAGRQQLIVYHFMLAPGWDEGCLGCSFVADHFDGTLAHLQARDVSFVAVSSAPLDEILRFKERMGWRFNWVSSHGTTFNHDFGVSFTADEIKDGKASYNFGGNNAPGEEMPGLSVFARDPADAIYRTYASYSRGLEAFMATYALLDVVPKGRDENPEKPMNWVRHHDRYENPVVVG
jgi:predicted dithiol-disulfide oxidoreductase (DUF899 family)